ncbi:MAG TPA: nucleotidyltransferase family protein [Ignavibacteria bacterium]|nr:nucleotidyltransferase family protein [Ignavibacteria bacterium]
MKAVILAAGKGERFREVTDAIPKPMLVYKDKPVLEHNILLCKKYGITDLYINLHHLPDVIKNYFGDGSKFGVSIKYSFEDELLGTSGAVKKIANNFLQNSKEDFFVIYGDNYSDLDLSMLKNKFDEVNPLGVIGFHYREDVSSSGVALFDENFKIKEFIEKPKTDVGTNWVNAGIYYFSPEVLNFIPEGYSDFGRDIFPDLMKKNQFLYGVCYKDDVLYFDTKEFYNKNIS